TERERSEFEIEADVVLDAFSREVEVRGLSGPLRLRCTMADTVAVDGGSMAAGVRGVFAAGDMVTGPRSVVEAIASGQKAARGIRAYLEGDRTPSIYDQLGDDQKHPREFALERLPGEHTERSAVPREAPEQRRNDFREVEHGYQERVAKLEAQRCLRCGLCAECVTCTDICERKDLQLALGEERTITVHAERDFWDCRPSEVSIELDNESRSVPAVRTVTRVRPELCVGCGRCEQACGFSAVRVNTFPGGRFVSEVNEIACKGCGTCVGVCPTGAMDQINFERSRLHASIDGIEPGTKRVLFVCRWARPETIDVPEDVHVIEVMCTGRLTSAMILEAVRTGCTGVMVCGCSDDRCHYGGGRRQGDRAVAHARDILTLLGYDPGIVTDTACEPRGFHRAIHSWVIAARTRPVRS
ncbi:MAG TPA: hydrogenase iron-sulfur subunit, partial [Patescibacteria group bacterium]|nr:hydrogenase iron-sulfur subunit [Patescibacteria group bacterium]